MGIVPKVKCRGCDRTYSGLRNKCPHCGARRNKGGKRAASSPDPMARLIIGVLLLAAILCSVISIIWMNVRSDDDDSAASPEQEQEDSLEDDTETSPAETVEPTVAPAETVTSVDINWQYKIQDNEMTLAVGETVDLECEIYPTDAQADIAWTSDTPSVCTVTPDGSGGSVIEAVGTGVAIITVSAGGQTAELIVSVR